MTAITISQALRRVKKLKGRMGELKGRAQSVVSYEAGKKPDFSFKTLRSDIEQTREELVTLQGGIARANATNVITVEDRQMTIAEAVRRLDELKGELAWLPSLILRDGVERQSENDYDEATSRMVRRTREVTYMSELKEPERVAEIDALRDRFERLNDAVERANHVTPVDWKPPTAAPATA